ncbi:unnamed protein product [Dicrocoelium dendriticum]|nr:unnamed protein product [Dicrocoelium dendriticum]
MQTELWQQADLTSRLTEQVSCYQKQLNSTTEAPQPLKSVQRSNDQIKEITMAKDSLLCAAEPKRCSVLPTGKLNREFYANSENKAPPSDSAPVAVPISAMPHSKLSSDLEKQNASEHTKTKQSELPSECETS